MTNKMHYAPTLGTRFKNNVISGMAMSLLNIAILTAAYPIYIGYLGYERYGVWLTITTILTVTQLGSLGIRPSITKLIAECYQECDLAGIRAYATASLFILAISGLTILSVVVLFRTSFINALHLSAENKELVSHLLPYAALISAFAILVQVFDAVLAGLGRIDITHYIGTCGRGITFVVAATMMHFGLGIQSLLAASAISLMTCCAFVLLATRHTLGVWPIGMAGSAPRRIRQLLGLSSGVFGTMLINLMFAPMNRLLAVRFCGVDAAPIFDIALNASMQFRAIIESGISALVPEVSRLSATAGPVTGGRVRALLQTMQRVVVQIGSPIYLVLSLSAGVFLKLWLHNAFTVELPPVFRIMLAASFCSLLGVPAYYTLLGLGRVQCCFWSSALQALANTLIVMVLAFLCEQMSVSIFALGTLGGMAMSTIYLNAHSRLTLSRLSS